MTSVRLLALTAGCCAAVAAQPTTASVNLRVVDYFGRPLSYRVASFAGRKTGVDLKSLFNGLVAAGIPYGSYKYSLVRADIQQKGDFGAVGGELWVEQPGVSKTLVTTGRVLIIDGHEAAMDSGGLPKNYSRQGRVTHAPENTEPNWIRIQSLFGGQVVEAAVGPNGEFTLYEPLEGQYLLVVMAHERVVSVEARVFDKRFSTDPIVVALTTATRQN